MEEDDLQMDEQPLNGGESPAMAAFDLQGFKKALLERQELSLFNYLVVSN